MNKKQASIYGLVGVVFAILVYVQFRTWRNFDWATFWAQTDHIDLWHVGHAIALIYIAYIMRAFRWQIFLRPVRPKASALGLVAPTLIGFTGLAVLGRPGELIRPYLIARRHNLSFSSQVAVWAVERIFDIGGFTFLLIMAAFLATAPKRLSYYADFQKAGLFFTVLVVGLTVAAIVMDRRGEALAAWVERRFAHLASNFGQRAAMRIREFSSGLKTIHSPWSLVQLIALSIGMWAVIAVAYKEVTHSYGAEPLEIPQTQVLLLMGSSMVGSTIQLPGVGGGSQLATIAALEHIFDVPKELAASCGILLWLVTFVAVVPFGLLLAHREHLSLRKLSKESHQAEAGETVRPAEST
ncbi:MAG TPA: lysylphosphatidylglycerol synthase transmembrane domain-containing protein [Terriglobales bacterium]|nr:lysylphosphatidylglycerol synthase transmembrane domain-containing protein [Terriglobales bacterium]